MIPANTPAPRRRLPNTPRSLRSGLLTTGAAIAVLGIGIWANVWPWIADDAFISLRYAQRLVEGQGLTWNDGERVEGYSNPLWVLLTAGLGWCGVDWVHAVRGLGLACTIATFAVLACSGLVQGLGRGAILVLAGLSTTAVWSIGGLEGPLVLLLLVGTAACLQRAGQATDERWSWWAGGLLALVVWTRPEGPLWAAITVAAFWWWRRLEPNRGRGGDRGLLVPPLLAVALLVACRRAYYGEWLPNTAFAKGEASTASLQLGLQYLGSALLATRALGGLALIGLLLSRPRGKSSPVGLFAALGLGLWSAYVVQIGGDGFPCNRMFLPALAPMVLLAAHGLQRLASGSLWSRRAAWALCLGSGAVGLWDVVRPPVDARQQLSTWEWSGVAIGTWLGKAFPERPLLAVDAAGALPFASGLPSLDLLGLCDHTIARSPVPADWPFRPAHNRGNGAYVLERQPDLVVFGLPVGSPQPRFLSGVQMEAEPRFLADYRCVMFQTGPCVMPGDRREDFKVTAWVRLPGRLGPQSDPSGNRLRVAGYWFGSYRQPYPFRFETHRPAPGDPNFATWFRDAELGLRWWQDAALVGVLDATSGRLVGEVRRHGEHRLRDLRLTAGRYDLVANVPAGVMFRLLDAGERPLARDGALWIVPADGSAPRAVDITCTVPPGVALPFALDAVELRRH